MATETIKNLSNKAITATASSSMSSGGFSAYYDPRSRIVTVSMSYQQSSTFDSNKVLWTIPAAYCPSENKTIPCVVFNSSNVPIINFVRVSTDG